MVKFMKLYDGGALVIGILVVALVAGYASSHFLGEDNPVEEAAEEVIESQTGMDIDLSPGSEEKKA
jgi:hypothetical protein